MTKANPKILEQKQLVIDEITEKVKNSNAVVWFEYRGLTVTELNDLRRKLRESNSEIKVYKNTLTVRALDSLKIDLKENLVGPKAMAYGEDSIAPIKVLSTFSKTHPALEIKVGIVDGEVADINKLKSLATLPSRDALLTMFAGGLIEHLRNIAICIDLHSKNLEKENN